MTGRTWLAVLTISVLTAQAAWADGIGVFGAYWSPKDFDRERGYGAKLKFSLGPDVFLDIRGSRFEFEHEGDSLKVIPIEAVLIFHLQYTGSIYPYIGGGGGYYLMDAEWEGAEGRSNVSDEFGLLAVGGVEIAFNQRVAIFGEAMYRWLKVEAVRGEDGGSDDKLDGLGVNAGLIIRW